MAQRQISYSDLDLRQQWGADQLVSRVRTTARRLCWDLSARYPASSPDDQTCYVRSMKEVMPQIDAAIARARGEYAGHCANLFARQRETCSSLRDR